MRVDVEAVVAAATRVEILRQRQRRAAGAAARIEHRVIRLEPAEADKMAEKFRADGPEIAVTDQSSTFGRHRHEVVRQVLRRQPVDTRRADTARIRNAVHRVRPAHAAAWINATLRATLRALGWDPADRSRSSIASAQRWLCSLWLYMQADKDRSLRSLR